jgi:hypothetical protein
MLIQFRHTLQCYSMLSSRRSLNLNRRLFALEDDRVQEGSCDVTPAVLMKPLSNWGGSTRSRSACGGERVRATTTKGRGLGQSRSDQGAGEAARVGD